MSEPKSTVIEMVVYHINPEAVDRYAFLLEQARREVRKFSGIMEYETFRSTKNPNTFMDLVYWNSLEEAQAAASQIGKLPELKPWMAAFEKIELMDHFTFFH